MIDKHTTGEPGEPEKPLGSPAAAGANLLGSLASFREVLAPPQAGNQMFWRALAIAVLLHGAMFVPLVGFSGNAELQRRMGEADGDPNAINVDVVEQSAMPGAAEPPAQPAPPPQEALPPPVVMMEPPPAPQEPPPQEPIKEALKEPPKELPKEPPKEPAKEPAKQQAAAPPEPPAEKPPPLPPAGIRGTTDPDGPVAEKPVPPPQPAKDEKAAQTAAQTAALMKEMTDLFAPEPPRKNAPQPKQGPAQPTPPGAAPSVLDNPPQFHASSSSFARPVDITRSGENDEFGRGVIRSLRQTMPPPLGIKARVTIMFYLTPLGEFAELRLVQGSGYPVVDQSVMFAARNSTFPRPPPGSKNSDRIFLVTYIYE